MGFPVVQPSFAAGELSPELFGRVDLAKFGSGARTCRNLLVQGSGGVTKRPGSGYVAATKASGEAVLIPFRFNAAQTYVLEFGAGYLRVFQNGAQVVYPGGHPSAGSPVEIATPYAAADLAEIGYAQSLDVVYLVHPAHPVQRLSRTDHHLWTLAAVTFASTAEGAPSIGVAPEIAGTTRYRYRVTSAARGVASAAEGLWVPAGLWKAILGASKTNPVQIRIADGGGETIRDDDDIAISGVVGMTQLNSRNFVVSGVSWDITAVTLANPCVITVPGHPWATGDTIRIRDCGGTVELNSPTTTYTVTTSGANDLILAAVDATAFTAYTGGGIADSRTKFHLAGENGTGHGTYVSGGVIAYAAMGITDTAADLETVSGAANLVTWYRTDSSTLWNVYRQQGAGPFAWVGDSTTGAFRDTGALVPDYSRTVRSPRNPFAAAGQYPAAVALDQQRLIFGGTDSDPRGLWWSCTGSLENFTVGEPLVDTDAITLRLVALEASAVRHLVPLRGLLVLTSGPDFLVRSEGPITPFSLYAEPQGYRGASRARPLTVGDAVLYVQDRGSRLWELAYSLQANGLGAAEITMLARHLFDGHTIRCLAYSQVPDSIVWAVRDDGVLLGLTYLREHEIYAWHRHDLAGGVVEWATVVPEGAEDRVYLVVRRTINGSTVRYVEHLAPRYYATQEEAVHLDCSSTYAGAPVSSLSGLGHLEGAEVYAYADGYTVGPLTVAGGAVALGDTFSRVTVGLAVVSDLETLAIEGAPEFRGKRRRVTAVSVYLRHSRTGGVWVGPDADRLLELPGREVADGFGLPPLVTGPRRIPVQPTWDDEVRVFLRHSDPAPLTVLSITPELDVGG